MYRYRIDIEYDGAAFAGWQRQAELSTVQGAIEAAALAFSGETISLRGAGRTDAGVHATGQVAHFDVSRLWPDNTVRNALNARLKMAGDAVAILGARQVPDSFDARFSATGRHYLYRILNRRAPAAIDRGKVWWVPKALNAEAMHEAAQLLLGRHDFTTFRSSQCQASSPIRSLDRLDVTQVGDVIEIRASARSFLHNQVRSMVGSLKRVGEGGWRVDDVRAALDRRDRAACAGIAPPDGLYLTGVDYPASGDMPNSPRST